MRWLRIREMVRKEFIQLFRDKRNRPLLIALPLIQLLLFGYVLNTDVKDIRLGVFDQSKTAESRRLIDAFRGNPLFRIVATVPAPGRLERLLLARKIDLALELPPDFSAGIHREASVPVQVLADGSMSNIASERISHFLAVVEQENNRILGERYGTGLRYGKIDVRVRNWFNPNGISQHFFVPAIAAFLVMLLTFLLTSMAIIREKEAGTMEQLMVTPLSAGELILGKTIPFIIIAQVQMVVVTAFAKFWFDLPFVGSALLLFFATSLFLLSTLGIGLFISTISKTQQQAMMTVFFFMLPFFMLSGFIFPIDNMPVAVQWLTLLNPLRYMLVIIRGIFLKGTGMGVLWHQFVALTVLGTVVFTGAVVVFNRQMGKG